MSSLVAQPDSGPAPELGRLGLAAARRKEIVRRETDEMPHAPKPGAAGWMTTWVVIAACAACLKAIAILTPPIAEMLADPRYREAGQPAVAMPVPAPTTTEDTGMQYVDSPEALEGDEPISTDARVIDRIRDAAEWLAESA